MCVVCAWEGAGGRGGWWWGIQSPDGPDMDLVLQPCQQGFYTRTNYMCSHLLRTLKKKLRKTNSLTIYHVFFMTKLENKPKDPISISNFLNSLKQVHYMKVNKILKIPSVLWVRWRGSLPFPSLSHKSYTQKSTVGLVKKKIRTLAKKNQFWNYFKNH